jgi:heme-degrading monooxygenase HmoA
MIARIWRGATREQDGELYLRCLEHTGLADYARVPGHLDTITLRRQVDGRAEFVLLTLWESMDAVRRFAGDAPSRAVFYDEVDHLLIERDERVAHYDIVHRHASPP